MITRELTRWFGAGLARGLGTLLRHTKKRKYTGYAVGVMTGYEKRASCPQPKLSTPTHGGKTSDDQRRSMGQVVLRHLRVIRFPTFDTLGLEYLLPRYLPHP